MDSIRWTMFLALLLMFMGCAADAQRAREAGGAARVSQTKAAAATPPLVLSPTSTPLSASIEAVDIQKGDCVNSRLPEGIDIESVEIVECSGSWQYRALSSFRVEASGPYPGADYFLRQATGKCDRRYSNILAPNAKTWLLGGRTVNCIQASYGLASRALIGLGACDVLGATEPQKPPVVSTLTPIIQATIEAAEQAAVGKARVRQIIATKQAAQSPTPTPAPTITTDIHAIVEQAVQSTIATQLPEPTATHGPTPTPIPTPVSSICRKRVMADYTIRHLGWEWEIGARREMVVFRESR